MAAAASKDDEQIKNSIHMEPDYLQFLKIQAATDAKHDLGIAFTNIYKEKKHNGIPVIGTPHDPFEATKGTGWDIVNLILETEISIPDDTPPPKDQFDIPRKDIPPIITKFSNFEYELTTMNINDATKPSTLFDFLKDNDDQTELCLIVDATTGSFQKIFAKMEKEEVKSGKRHVYYIVNRETISDPAGKPNEKDADFNEKRNKNREIELHIALDTTTEKVCYPKWIDPRMNYRSDFFSDFTLELTPVKYGVTKSVILTFSGTNYKDESTIETSASGKLANSKNAMIKLLKRVYDKIGTLYQIFDAKTDRKKIAIGKNEDTDLKDYFVGLQKKRSGDTLIALSFFDTSRTYNGNSQTFTFNEKPRFVLTHDTFNTLPVSLANGGDVIYTGADTVYKFKRVKERTDFTKAFFDTYMKKKESRDEMTSALKSQTSRYLEKLSAIKKEIKDALDNLENYLKRDEARQERFKSTTFVISELEELKNRISASLQLFFKLALFRSIYMMPVSILKFLSEVDELSKIQEYDTSLKNRVDRIKEIYYSQRPKDTEYSTGFPQFDKSYINNIVYKEIKTFETILSGNSFVNFGKKANKFTFGASPIIHNYLFMTDGTQRFTDILQTIADSPYISGGRAEKNKAPMKEILSTFINLTPLNSEDETSVKTEDLLSAAHGEIGVTEVSSEVQAVSSVSCVIPYHEGIRQRIIATAETLITEIKNIFDSNKKSGGARIDEKKVLELSSFILFNYMIEMNVYFEGEYNDPNIDVYGQVIPMTGKLLLYAMSFSRDPMCLLLFFMRMVYYADNKSSFEQNYKGGYFLPSIFETILSNAFGPEFLESFQEFSLNYFPKVLKHPRLRSLVPPMLEMANPKWELIENNMKMKIIQITGNLHELSLAPVSTVSPGKRVRNWEINDREEIAAIGGRYKKTRKFSKRTTKAKSRRNKK